MLSEEEWKSFHRLLDIALEEDLGLRGDVTSEAIFQAEQCICRLVSKDHGVLAGIECFLKVFQRIDPKVRWVEVLEDGVDLSPGMVVARLSGPTKSILQAERTALNFVGYLSGIATTTRRMVLAIKGKGKAVILDTRKTLPGYRALAKYAVRIGGGKNHRFGLYDMVLIKDNHIDAVGSLSEAVKRVRARWGKEFLIEVECRTLEDVKEAVEARVDRILLDNMDVQTTRSAVQWVGGRVPLESSGDMTLERVEAYAATGVDFISAGRLTHSVPSFNFSLQVERKIT
ncbi:MAG: carboxylating nicotinate-nucleotide diphosphorylase [Spirochaetes bacterium]|nr:carboxylating nicotinate-nucleotide diphosphorylase [Spirochaetota bacterium]